MVQLFRTSTPQYVVCGTDDQHFDIFNKKRKAIKKALEMAMEYPGTTFQVCEKVNWESKVIFSINIEVKCKFEDVPDYYHNIIDLCRNKLDKMKFWRKPDGSSD